ncbi:hypothetical protein K505DRAFT_355203 [Melanomma pulvis-pyrius CBS 109.77]|uniref:Uncharacterized protein n=1 Tax=Melanomma pulvis-pyrius CBS 109.77 TaxID=1314802 RepID=A0A6A6XWM4_9PLEO|nr:hypothetical protein K505DRAFT_355203 [Melanomma pulvis-pyrius CBS 109.77]
MKTPWRNIRRRLAFRHPGAPAASKSGEALDPNPGPISNSPSNSISSSTIEPVSDTLSIPYSYNPSHTLLSISSLLSSTLVKVDPHIASVLGAARRNIETLMDVESENKRLKRELLGYKMAEWDDESDEDEDEGEDEDEDEDEDGRELDMIRAERDEYKKQADTLSQKVEKLIDGLVSIMQQCNATFAELENMIK